MNQDKPCSITNDLKGIDYIEIARLHKKLIPEGNLSALPLKFLVSIYKSISKSKYSFLYVAKYKNQIVGFIAGSVNTKKVLRSFVISNFYRIDLFFMVLLHSLKNHKTNQNKETLDYILKEKKSNLPKSEILNFCIDENFQGKGVSSLLFAELNKSFIKKGVKEYKIDTGGNQISAQKFYEKKGAKKVFIHELHKGIKSIIYTVEL